MTTEQTISKLKELKLHSMAEAFQNQMTNRDYRDLSFEERLGLMVDIEWSTKKTNKIQRLVTKAQLKYSAACIESIDYFPDRKLDKSLILTLATNQYIRDQRNITLKGPSGGGKTFVACALGMAAIRNEIDVLYIRLPDLLMNLAIARDNGAYQRLMKKYKKVQLMILDEWLLTELTERQITDILELVEARDGNSSTIYCSQYDTNGWYENLGQGTLADAILDRIIHTSYDIIIDSEVSMRERYGINK